MDWLAWVLIAVIFAAAIMWLVWRVYLFGYRMGERGHIEFVRENLKKLHGYRERNGNG